MKTVNFWKTASIRKVKRSSVKPFSFLKLSNYPKRSKRELNLIDKHPFGDYDRDKVPNATLPFKSLKCDRTSH